MRGRGGYNKIHFRIVSRIPKRFSLPIGKSPSLSMAIHKCERLHIYRIIIHYHTLSYIKRKHSITRTRWANMVAGTMFAFLWYTRRARTSCPGYIVTQKSQILIRQAGSLRPEEEKEEWENIVRNESYWPAHLCYSRFCCFGRIRQTRADYRYIITPICHRLQVYPRVLSLACRVAHVYIK